MLTSLFKKVFVLFLIMTFNFIIISSAYTLLTFSTQGEFRSLGFEPTIQESIIPIAGMYPGNNRIIYVADVHSDSELNTQMLLKITSDGDLFNQDNKVNAVPIELFLYIDDEFHTSFNISTDSVLLELPTQKNLTLRIDAIWPSSRPYHEYKGTNGSLTFELTISQ